MYLNKNDLCKIAHSLGISSVQNNNSKEIIEKILKKTYKNKGCQQMKTIKIKTNLQNDEGQKIVADKAKQFFPKIVKWYEKILSYLPYIKIETLKFPYLKITLPLKDYEYIKYPTILADPDSDGNHPLFYKNNRYWVYGSVV